MKKRPVFFAGIAALVLAGCFSPYSGDNGSITIALGGVHGETSRVLVNPDTELANLRHEITLQGPGGIITRTVTGGGVITVEAAPGNWTVKVRARGPKPAFYVESMLLTGTDFPEDSAGNILRAMGETSVTVTSGVNVAAEINMITATEVASWAQLRTAVNCASGVAVDEGELLPIPREEIIILYNDMKYEGSLWAGAGIVTLEDIVGPNDEGKTITLMADKPVTVTRVGDVNSFFQINNGTLILGRPGMTGTITFDGGWGGSGATPVQTGAPLIDVNLDGMAVSLVMNEGVTLTNNYCPVVYNGEGGFGGAISVIGGNFTMNGGTISDNFAQGGQGGGVYISNGKFTMNGGIIRGNSAGPSDISGAGGNGGGVYIYRTVDIQPENAYFIKTGGIIYGDDGSLDANVAEDSSEGAGRGAAVYYVYEVQDEESSQIYSDLEYRESTLNETDRLSTNDLATGWETAQ